MDYQQELFDNALDNFDEPTFDVFTYENLFGGTDKALPYMIHKMFQKYDLYKRYYISTETLHNFSCEVSYSC